LLPESEEEAERRRLMRERKTVVLPVEVLDDPSLSPVEIVILAQILRFQSRIGRFTVNGMNQFLNFSKNTIRKGLLKLAATGYLTTLPGNKGWVLNEVKICTSEDQNLNFGSSKSELSEIKICVSEREEERTKEEDKENHNIDYIYNNTIRVKDNEKEREKKREKDPAEGLTSTIENRGVHGDSSFMLDGVPSSSENPSVMADGNAKEIQERAEEVPEPEKPVEAEKPERFTAEYREIIDYLNTKTGKHYSARSRANQQHMSARLKEGRTVEDFKRVIDIKCFQWLDDPKMSQYLRPETLFSGKFDRYLNEEFKVTRKGPNGWEYTVTDEPDELDLIFGGGKHG